MIKKPKSVEALALAIFQQHVYSHWSESDVDQAAGKISDFIRSHNIDPATMQPTEKQQPADKAHREPCPYDTNGDGDCGRRHCPHCGIEAQSPQPAEPVVTDEDREFYARLADEIMGSAITDAKYLRNLLEWNITRARQAEREELRRLRKSLRDTEDQLVQVAAKLAAKCGDDLPRGSGDTLAKACCRKIDDLQAKLAAAEARAALLDDAAWQAVTRLKTALRQTSQQPATADAKGGS